MKSQKIKTESLLEHFWNIKVIFFMGTVQITTYEPVNVYHFDITNQITN